jgi:hypothetical protein
VDIVAILVYAVAEHLLALVAYDIDIVQYNEFLLSMYTGGCLAKGFYLVPIV